MSGSMQNSISYRKPQLMYRIKSWLNNLRYKIKGQGLKLCLKYIRYYSKDTNYVKHANKEYSIAWPDYKNDTMQSYMCDQINDLLFLLATQGDSGSTIGYKLDLFIKLAKFKIIKPLTFDNDEFNNNLSLENDIYQNNRNSKVFKKGNKYSYLDSFIRCATWYIGDANEVIKRNGGNWTGGVFVIPEDNSEIYYLQQDWIKDITNFSESSFYINSYELECPKDWWMSFCKESDLKEYLTQYNFEKDYTHFEKELNFKGGIYEVEILTKIELIKQHMKSN